MGDERRRIDVHAHVAVLGRTPDQGYASPGMHGSLLLARLRLGEYRAIRRERNYFDRQVLLFRALGWEPTSAPLERLLPAVGGG